MHARTPLRLATLTVSLAFVLALLSAASFTPLADPPTGYSERPIGVAPASAAVAENSAQFFRNKEFKGDMIQVSAVTEGKESWRAHSFGTWAKHFSSLRWSLPRGVIVTLYEEDDGRGRTINLWGSGEIAALSAWKLDNELASWSWNYVGGAASASKSIRDAQAERPRFAREVAGAAAMDSMIPFRDRDGKEPMPPIERITDKPANTFHELPKGVSSLQWNLPEGVALTFAGTKEGVGQQMATWGAGQFDTFAHWKMNDKMKFYAWHWIGEKR